MKTSSTWSLKSIVGKIMLGLVLVSMIGSIDMAPALGKDNDKRMGKHDNGRYEHRGRGYGHGRWHDRGGYRYYNDGYRERIYVAPPVYYAPPPRPGVHVFFPPIYVNP